MDTRSAVTSFAVGAHTYVVSAEPIRVRLAFELARPICQPDVGSSAVAASKGAA